ncbi:MAG: ATP-binding protein [Emergencia sp.]
MKMKNTSIRTRVTLYYSLTMIFITVFLLIAFLLVSSRQISVASRDTVMKAVQNSFDEIEYGNDFIEIDDDFDSYKRGVTLLVYTEGGRLIKGSVPKGFPAGTPLSAGEFQQMVADGETYLIYDLYNTYENGQGIWVRGIYAMEGSLTALKAVTLIILIALPAILVFVILAGRRITRQAFIPVAEIADAADSISNGQDLSRRLPMGKNKDELYHLSKTLNQMIERLEEAFKAEKEFSSDVSHELKTPVSVMLAECEYALQETRSPEEYQETLQMIQGQCRRTMSLIQQLLQMSRTLDREKMLEREEFDLSVLCESIAEELSLVAEEKGICLKHDIQPDICIYADETLILRMIMNLLTNGMKYSRPDAADSAVLLKLRKDPHTENTVITVEDNGIGIRKEDLENIFHRFYKVDKSRTGGEESFGLGLSMVRWIARAHGGDVRAESTFGEGSRFTVTLPSTLCEAPPETDG